MRFGAVKSVYVDTRTKSRIDKDEDGLVITILTMLQTVVTTINCV